MTQGQCANGTFSGDWGDPVAMSGEVAKQHPKETGAETVAGIATKIFEAAVPGGAAMKAWVDPKTGLLLRAQMIPGGGVGEMTAQLRNGALRIENPPSYFHVETVFGNGGSSDALIYRHCSGAQTTLLLVVKDPGHVAEGADWLWVKSGKYAH